MGVSVNSLQCAQPCKRGARPSRSLCCASRAAASSRNAAGLLAIGFRTERGCGQRPSRSSFANQKAPSKVRVHSVQTQRAEVLGESVESAGEVALRLRKGSATVPVALPRVPHSSFPRQWNWHSPQPNSTGARLWAAPHKR